MNEQPVLPERRIVGGELLVRADQLPEPLVSLVERLEDDVLRRPADLDAVLRHRGQPGHLQIQHRPGV